MLLVLPSPGARTATAPKTDTLIEHWMTANRADFEAAANYDRCERVTTDDGSKTYDDVMLFGSPYQQLVAVNGQPLSAAERRNENERFVHERDARAKETPEERAHRTEEYQKSRAHAHQIIEELPNAFAYRLLSTKSVASRRLYVLRATPRPGYAPPDAEAAVLTGMQAEFWIDSATYQLFRGTGRVMRPVTIEGFLATVQPGTEFELEQRPVDDRVWLPTHFQIRSHSSVLFLFHHHNYEDHTYFNYRKSTGAQLTPTSTCDSAQPSINSALQN